MALDNDSVDAIAAHLESLPPITQMTVSVAILKLKPVIKKMQARGYTTDQIATAISAYAQANRLQLKVSGRTLVRALAGVPKKS